MIEIFGPMSRIAPQELPAFLPSEIIYEFPQKYEQEPLWAAFTPDQRHWIKQRDGSKCVAPFSHRHEGELHVHHVIPQGWNAKHNFPADYPENGITICVAAHYTIHPEMATALTDYRNGDHDAFKDAFASHGDRDVYWVDKYDPSMLRYTKEATKKYERDHPWPNGHRR